MKYVRKYFSCKRKIFSKEINLQKKILLVKDQVGGINPFYFNKIKNKTAKKF